MRVLFWFGLVILVLGILSFFVPVPQYERHGVSAGGGSISIEIKHTKRLPAVASVIMTSSGILMMVNGKPRG